MSTLDWIILCLSLGGIAGYGAWKTRTNADLDSYFRASGATPWYVIGFSVMATQASAITFLSTPGQGYATGLSFVQFYFGLPLALIVVAAVFVPAFQRLKVITAYQFLEHRFDRRVRQFTAFLFLIQRGLAVGLTIYAPAIILSALLGWELDLANVVIGSVVVLYTMIGGSRAVNVTQMMQMGIIFFGMLFAFGYTIYLNSEHASFFESLQLAAVFNRTEAINTSFDPTTRYTLWSGLTGGFFLALAYFGTDQSQVQRYISGKSQAESKLGLIFNAALKIPMQFFILLTGVLVFVFFLFSPAPIFFNQSALATLNTPTQQQQLSELQSRHTALQREKSELASGYVKTLRDNAAAIAQSESASKLMAAAAAEEHLRGEVKALLKAANPRTETKDTDYVFLSFILAHLPQGLIGLLLAAIICAAMSSTSSELNALASTTVVDFYRVSIAPHASERKLVFVSKLATLGWGIVAIGFATIASLFENLIQAVNIVGSLFYGTILGIFVVALTKNRISATQLLCAAITSEAVVLTLYATSDIGFLWFNFIGCMLTAGGAWLLARVSKQT